MKNKSFNIVLIVKLLKREDFKLSCTDEEYEKYKKYEFKDLGCIVLTSIPEKERNTPLAYNAWHGFRTPEYLKEKLGNERWKKFCNGKREFIFKVDKVFKNNQYNFYI